MKKPLLSLCLLALCAGCSTYQVTRMEDHPSRPITRLEATKHTNFFLWEKAEHQFYLCEQRQDRLACQLACGGSTDIHCPEALASGAVVSTNVR